MLLRLSEHLMNTRSGLGGITDKLEGITDRETSWAPWRHRKAEVDLGDPAGAHWDQPLQTRLVCKTSWNVTLKTSRNGCLRRSVWRGACKGMITS